MPKKTLMSRMRARELALAALGLPETTLDWGACERRGVPPEGYAGAMTRVRRQGEVFRVSVWVDAADALESEPNRYLEVQADEEVVELPTDAQERQNAARRTGKPRGRPPSVPEGLDRNPRISFTPSPQVRDQIYRLAEESGMTEAGVVAQLVEQALRSTSST